MPPALLRGTCPPARLATGLLRCSATCTLQRLLASQPGRRLNPAKIAEAGVLRNRLVETLSFLDNLALKDSGEKVRCFGAGGGADVRSAGLISNCSVLRRGKVRCDAQHRCTPLCTLQPGAAGLVRPSPAVACTHAALGAVLTPAPTAPPQDAFFRKLPSLLPSIPKVVAQRKLLPMLAGALEFGGAPPVTLNTLLQIGDTLEQEDYAKQVRGRWLAAGVCWRVNGAGRLCKAGAGRLAGGRRVWAD